MTAEPVRVALLAGAGLAGDRLRAAIDQAGAHCVLQADPAALDPAALVQAAPKVVLVALDPQVEDALERFDEVLFDPAIEVIYEEAALATTREGWDVARWQRHLVAKLQQHGDVLPPGGEPEDPETEAAGSADAPAFGTFDGNDSPGGDVFGGDAEAAIYGDAIAGDSAAPPTASVAAGLGTGEATTNAGPAREASPSGEAADESVAFSPDAVPDATRLETAPVAFHPFDPVFAETGDEGSLGETAFDETPLTTLEVEFEPVAMDGHVDAASGALPGDAGMVWSLDADVADTAADDGFAQDSGQDSEHDGDVAAHAEAPPPAPEPESESESEPEPEPEPEPESESESALTPEPASGPRSFGELSLDDGSAPLLSLDNDEAKNRFQRDISDLEVRISGLTLVDDTPVQGPEQARGAVLVLAGLGGPDAVRQLLGALPEGFSRPVLVQQRLDGGRYEKLVAQMQRATALPVRLAEAGGFVHAGIVYILPAFVGVDVSDTGIRFNQDGELLAALPSGDSAVLLLSGSDAGQVDAVLNHGWSGALVAGQAAEGCYDAAAPNALAARGGDTGTPVELAQRLAQRWPS